MLILFSSDREAFIKIPRNFDKIGAFGFQHVKVRLPMAFRDALDQIDITGIIEVIKIKDVRSRIGVCPVEPLRLTIYKFRIDFVGSTQQPAPVPIDFGKGAS